jgi:hypothetical protein
MQSFEWHKKNPHAVTVLDLTSDFNCHCCEDSEISVREQEQLIIRQCQGICFGLVRLGNRPEHLQAMIIAYYLIKFAQFSID